MVTKDYAKIAAAKIRTPSQVSRQPRILAYSRNKKGKTHFGATAPDVLILDPEGGTDRMTKSNPNVWPIDVWDDMEEVVGYLRTKAAQDKYKWVSVDGLTAITNKSLRWVMGQAEMRDLDRKPNQVGKQDYGRSGKMMEELLYSLHSMPYGFVFTAQERQIETASGDDDEDAEESQIAYVPDLPKGVRGNINSIVDVIGRIYTVRTTVKARDPKDPRKIIERENQLVRRMWLEPHIMYDTGYRSEFVLPPYLQNPTVPKLVHLINEGKTRA